MKDFGEIVTTIAAMAFLLAFGIMEAKPVLAFAMLFISGIVIAIAIFCTEEKRTGGNR